jgi:colanic acid biosynthesis glycosyl transferase WcaI
MRILIHGLNFAPELTGIGKYTGELAVYLADQGHQVRVVTSPPYYPQWRIAAGYSGWSYRKEQWQGMEVYRCPLWVPRKPSGIKRILYLGSFALFSLPVILAQVRWKPALLINIAPAIASTPFSWLAARLAGSKAWLHIQDFELDTAANLKMLPGLGLTTRLSQNIEASCLKGFDRVSTISQRMLERLWQKGVPADKSFLLPNWVDIRTIYPLAKPSSLRADWGIPPDRILVLYAGNMGQKQGLETLLDAARQLSDEEEVYFILCGEGAARVELEQQAAGLSNVCFMPLQPEERLNDLLNAADIHVLPQRAHTADLVMPSKLGGMLASGRPVVATARPGTELAEVVSQVGLVVPPEDPGALADAIGCLVDHPAIRSELAVKGRQFVETYWTKEHVLASFLNEINLLTKTN